MASRQRRHPLASSGGFTLIEILAALTILGTALFVLLDAHYSALNLHVLTDEELIYRQFLESTVSRAELEVLQGTLSDSGDFGLRYPDFTWSYEAVEMDPSELLDEENTFDTTIVEEGLVPLFQVTATVAGPDEPRSLDFYVFNTGLPQDESGNRMFNSGGIF